MPISAELRPGAVRPIFARLAAEAQVKIGAGLVETGAAVERQAKLNASVGRHPYGTPSVSPGNPMGPSIISATLVDSITHTAPRMTRPGSWELKVGMEPGHTPWYRPRGPNSATYARYLEVTGAGRSRHLYPFLVPALKMAGQVAVYTAFRRTMATGWG